jgi:hypothetical protein
MFARCGEGGDPQHDARHHGRCRQEVRGDQILPKKENRAGPLTKRRVHWIEPKAEVPDSDSNCYGG